MAKRVSIKSVLDSTLKELKIAIQQLYISKGLLKNSDLVKSVEPVNKRNVIQILTNFYVDFINSGRKKRLRKIPISALIRFIKQRKLKLKKGQSINNLAFAIQNAIYKQGIRARKISKPVEDLTEKIILKNLSSFFNTEIIEDNIIRAIKK